MGESYGKLINFAKGFDEKGFLTTLYVLTKDNISFTQKLKSNINQKLIVYLPFIKMNAYKFLWNFNDITKETTATFSNINVNLDIAFGMLIAYGCIDVNNKNNHLANIIII